MARSRRFAGMRGLGIPVLGHGGRHLPGHAHATAAMVSGDVVDDDPEERCQRSRAAARAGPEAVSDGLDMAAQVAAAEKAAQPCDAAHQGGLFDEGQDQEGLTSRHRK